MDRSNIFDTNDIAPSESCNETVKGNGCDDPINNSKMDRSNISDTDEMAPSESCNETFKDHIAASESCNETVKGNGCDDSINNTEMDRSNISDTDDIAPSESCNETAESNGDESNLGKGLSTDGKRNDRSTHKDLQTLQSQQQRLQREAQFSIPYHKPKKYTLQEFLSRRTIMKPSEVSDENCSAESFGKSRSLKMSREELAVYSKLMEDRAKEASEFFKPEDVDNSKETASKNDESYNTTETMHGDSNIQVEDIKPETDNEECVDKCVSNVIITEVVELPRLDLKDVTTGLNLKDIVNQPVLAKEVNSFSLNSNAGISDIFKVSPTLKDDVDITFEMLSNEKEAPKAISRANSLLERLMKTNRPQRPKNTESNGILTHKGNSKALIDEADASLHKKPGETFLRLKDNLKTIIMEKRREELKKRQEEDNAKKALLDTDDEDEEEIDDSLEFDEKSLSESAENSDYASDRESTNHIEGEIDEEEISLAQKPLSAPEEEEEDYDEKEGKIKRRIEFPSDDSDLSQHHSPPTISQVPETQIGNREEETDQLINLCSGTFETQPVAPAEDKIYSKIVSSSEDEDFSSSNKPRTKKFTKKVIKKSNMKLGFSDDEDDESDDEADKAEQAGEEEEDILAEDDMPATYIDYDSEENEITVELTKQDRVDQAENFFEKEAELSESEWGSADEDEKNLDQYDIELGDEDEFDKEEIRAQLGKIHARKMLDEDIRQVNKLQEMLFEDEEDNSAKRERKFRWKNFDTAFKLETNANQYMDSKPEEGSDDENEHLWRKIRFEREQAIKNSTLNEISIEANTSVATPKTCDIKNITIVTMSKSRIEGVEEKEKSPFLISKELIKVESAKARSSFLLRNKTALTKTICSVKNSSTDVNTSPDKIGVKTINPSKFVFTTLTLEEHETLKRKADDKNDGVDMRIIKRPKNQTTKSEYLIDKLL
ncbi:PREDICTED: claspin-like isoform X2 [Rhagoletis zephyria]|nr:PREDICTED: claspin-like isoform X2 [Rhagoletis zephyria]